MVDMRKDAVFLPGKIHGCEDEIYIIYENPEANDGKGCFEIEICDYETILEVYEAVKHDAAEFFDLLPDYFHGRWLYANAPSESYNEYVEVYDKADFIFGRDGGIEEEMKFIIKWAISCNIPKGNTRRKFENKVYTPQKYLEKVTGNCYIVRGDDDAAEINRITRNCGFDLWDYPLSELEHIIENELNVVPVECLYWDEADKEYHKEYRWFELPDEES